ncbi:MAG: RNA-binding S4 domain-containing protein [Desulfuromonas sp.]
MDFSLAGHSQIELQQLLKVTGLCGSGGEAKQRIAAGEVSVDATIELRKRRKIHAGQQVRWRNHLIQVLP